MKKIGYKHTVAASFTAFVVQAVVNNFAPLLFLTFQAQYGIELSKITVLITANFFIQIFVDLTAVLFVDRIGYRASTVLAHAMCATGLIFMTILPEILPSAFAGLLISVFCYAVGAGLLDITINPIVNSCPSTNSNQLLCLLQHMTQIHSLPESSAEIVNHADGNEEGCYRYKFLIHPEDKPLHLGLNAIDHGNA